MVEKLQIIGNTIEYCGIKVASLHSISSTLHQDFCAYLEGIESDTAKENYDRGYEDGCDESNDSAYEDGKDEGYDEGYAKGQDVGFEAGQEAAMKEAQKA